MITTYTTILYIISMHTVTSDYKLVTQSYYANEFLINVRLNTSQNLSNGPAKKQAEKQQAAAIASVIFQALISLIKLNLNALIGQYSEKREI